MPTYYVRCGLQRDIVEARDRPQAALTALRNILRQTPVPALAPFVFVSRRSHSAWATAHRVDRIAELHGIALPSEDR